MKARASSFQKLNFTLILTIILLSLSIGAVSADGPEPIDASVQETCPDGGDWTKIDLSGDDLTYTVYAPTGKLIVETCYKAGTTVVYDGPFDPGKESYTFVSTVPNPTGNAMQGLSHVSYRTADVEYATASALVEACIEGDTSTPVMISVTGATMTITGPESFFFTLLPGQSFTGHNWPVGSYTISYTMEPGYTNPGNLPSGFTVEDCSDKEDAEAEAKVEACIEGSTTTPVNLSVNGAKMNITGPGSFTFSLNSGESHTGKDWPVGSYSITYELEEGYNNPGNLPSGFTIEDCSEKEDAEAEALVEACVEGSTSTPVVLKVVGATMHITLDGDPSFAMDHSGGPSTYKNLDPGTYFIAYTFEEGYKDPGTLPSSFVIEECKTDKEFADLSITVKCVYDPDNTCHRWTVSNPNDFPVQFEWSTGAKSTNYAEAGSATVDALGKYVFNTSYVSQTMVISYSDGEVVQVVTVDSGVCRSEEPDEPAGGSGPSLIITLTPALLTVSGIAVAWLLLKHRIKNI